MCQRFCEEGPGTDVHRSAGLTLGSMPNRWRRTRRSLSAAPDHPQPDIRRPMPRQSRTLATSSHAALNRSDPASFLESTLRRVASLGCRTDLDDEISCQPPASRTSSSYVLPLCPLRPRRLIIFRTQLRPSPNRPPGKFPLIAYSPSVPSVKSAARISNHPRFASYNQL